MKLFSYTFRNVEVIDFILKNDEGKTIFIILTIFDETQIPVRVIVFERSSTEYILSQVSSNF